MCNIICSFDTYTEHKTRRHVRGTLGVSRNVFYASTSYGEIKFIKFGTCNVKFFMPPLFGDCVFRLVYNRTQQFESMHQFTTSHCCIIVYLQHGCGNYCKNSDITYLLAYLLTWSRRTSGVLETAFVRCRWNRETGFNDRSPESNKTHG